MAKSTSPASPKLDDLLCFAVHSTGFAFNRLYRGLLLDLDLTYPQYLVMIALWGGDKVTVGQLGEQLALETSTLTPLLKRLETRDLLTRRRSESDERRVIIALTDKGRGLKRETAAFTRCIVEGTGLSPEEVDRITRALHALRNNLKLAAEKS